MKNKSALKFTASALAVAALPFVITKAASSPPDMSKLVAAAVNFTAEPAFAETEAIGNGSLILYRYSSEATAETGEGTRETKAETETGISTQETEAQTGTEKSTQETENEESTRETETETETETSTQETETETETEASTQETEAETAAEPITQETEPRPESGAYIITQNISRQKEDLSVFNGRDLQVEHMTFESNNGTDFLWLEQGGQVRNCTELDNDFVKEQMTLPTDIKIDVFSNDPQVLIMHTHACESYLTNDGSFQDESYTCRTADSSQSVVAVGQKIAEKLAENGICVLHDGTLHDYPSYNGSYDRAEETITGILEAYPSIKVVLDIHRDGIVGEDGTPIAAVKEINGRQAAQVMIISAASDGYYYVPNYLDNFHFACLLQQYMEKDNNGITRPILFEYCQYNQHLTTGSLLIEVGSQGNTLEQALYSGELIGESIAGALLTLA